jgi:hypothetical protein
MKEVRTTVATLGIIVVLAIVAASCAQEQEEPAIVTTSDFFLPVGDAAAGREAFVALECYSCHAVPKDPEMPPPTGEVVGPECGDTLAGKSREFIADSIISPSHIIPPPEVDSPMSELRAEMSVQQLIDLVAFCNSEQ